MGNVKISVEINVEKEDIVGEDTYYGEQSDY